MANGHGGKRVGSGRKPDHDRRQLEAVLDRAISVADREQIFEMMSHCARAGNVQAATLVLAYLYGKPVERQEVSGPEGEPIRIQHEFEQLRKLPADELIRLHRESLGTLSEAKR